MAHLRSWLTVTNLLVLLCVLVHFLSDPKGSIQTDLAMYYWQSKQFQSFQLFSHLFLHGGLVHLFINMLGLVMFGNILEKYWGAARFLGFYLMCGLGAALIYQGVNTYQFQAAIDPILALGISEQETLTAFAAAQYYPRIPSSEEALFIFRSPVIGASGALYGILVAFACCFPNHKMMLIFLPVPIAAKYFMPALLLIELFSGVTGFSLFGSNIAHAAHIGGAITGAIVMGVVFLQYRLRRF